MRCGGGGGACECVGKCGCVKDCVWEGFAPECTCLCLRLHVCVCVLAWVAEHAATSSCIHLGGGCQELQDLKVLRDPRALSIPPRARVFSIGADVCGGARVSRGRWKRQR